MNPLTSEEIAKIKPGDDVLVRLRVGEKDTTDEGAMLAAKDYPDK